MKTFSRNIQSLRGIAVLSVIFFHFATVQRTYSPQYPLPDILLLGAVGVDIFFLISGYLMMTVTRHFSPGRHSMQQFFLHRCIRIYPLYWVVSAPIIGIMLIDSPPLLKALHINPDMLHNVPNSPLYFLNSLLLIPQYNLPPLTVSWTLIHEMYFYCVFGFFLLFPSRSHISLLAIWSAVTLIFWQYLQPSQADPWPYLLCNPLTLEFTTGCFIAALLQRWQPSHPVLILLLGIVMTLISWHLWISQNSFEFPIAGDRVAYFLFPCAMVFLGIVGLESKGYIFGKILQHIGDASYSLYLTHILFLSIGRKLWQAYADQSSIYDSLIWWSGLFAVTMGGGILCFHLLEKPLLRGFRKLTRA